MRVSLLYKPMKDSELLTRAVEEVVPKPLAEAKLKSGKPMRLYFGIDPTGAKLHLGHSVPLRKMRAFQDAGHQVILLIGSFTAMIGDPTGKDEMRKTLTKEDVEKNFETYLDQAKTILDMTKLEIRYNHEWLEKVDFKKILELSSHFTAQQMLQRDMFKRRMAEDKPISVMEFMYPLMVGYDSVVLDVDVELGGNDQLFNMLAGRTLQTAFGKRDKFVLTTKLIEGTDGRKMSKTYDNCIYITDAPQDMYGKTMRILDNLIPLYMECCTGMSMDEVAQAEKALKDGKTNPKDLKMRLARELVTMYHGADAAAHAEQQFQTMFKDHGVPDDIQEVKVEKGSLLVDVLLAQKLVPSKSEFRRLVEQKGVHLNDETVTALDAKAEKGVVRVGKRKFLKIS
jgi:tyrosyl-tRNA synthetase